MIDASSILQTCSENLMKNLQNFQKETFEEVLSFDVECETLIPFPAGKHGSDKIFYSFIMSEMTTLLSIGLKFPPATLPKISVMLIQVFSLLLEQEKLRRSTKVKRLNLKFFTQGKERKIFREECFFISDLSRKKSIFRVFNCVIGTIIQHLKD